MVETPMSTWQPPGGGKTPHMSNWQQPAGMTPPKGSRRLLVPIVVAGGFTVVDTSDGHRNMESLPDMTLCWTPEGAR